MCIFAIIVSIEWVFHSKNVLRVTLSSKQSFSKKRSSKKIKNEESWRLGKLSCDFVLKFTTKSMDLLFRYKGIQRNSFVSEGHISRYGSQSQKFSRLNFPRLQLSSFLIFLLDLFFENYCFNERVTLSTLLEWNTHSIDMIIAKIHIAETCCCYIYK